MIFWSNNFGIFLSVELILFFFDSGWIMTCGLMDLYIKVANINQNENWKK
jgi:hypothetical protein